MERGKLWRGILIGSVAAGLGALVVALRRRRERPSPLQRGTEAVREGAGRLVEWSRGAARRLIRVRP